MREDFLGVNYADLVIFHRPRRVYCTLYLGAMASLDPMLAMLESFPGAEASHGAYNCTGKRLATITDGIIRIMALDARGGWALEEGGEIRSGQVSHDYGSTA